MAARTPRRTFASPFVVTLAALPIAGACSSPQTAPPHVNPPPPTDPAMPTAEPATPTPAPTDPAAPSPPTTDPSTPDPSQSKPPSNTRQWLVTRQGATCMAMARVECPKPATPDGPRPTCNPPPPLKYSPCPDGLADKASLTVVQYAGAAECVIQPEPIKCPPNVACNPPEPRVVPCPKR